MSDQQWLNLLSENIGFENPELWLAYARGHNFQRVNAEALLACPGCQGTNGKILGQYVYYSTLHKLRRCTRCALIYADARIQREVINQHFETAYKDESYFIEQRSAIFQQIARVVTRFAKPKACVLDIGGAKGHLIAEIQKYRPDLSLLLNDISVKACKHAKDNYQFSTFPGLIYEVSAQIPPVDIALLIDVLYYEPDLNRLMSRINSLVTKEGVVILRIPNKLFAIERLQYLRKLFVKHDQLQSQLKYFNPEHLYIFSRRFLRQLFEEHGFPEISFHPSPALQCSNALRNACYSIFHQFAICVYKLSAGRVILSPSMIIIAQRNYSGWKFSA